MLRVRGRWRAHHMRAQWVCLRLSPRLRLRAPSTLTNIRRDVVLPAPFLRSVWTARGCFARAAADTVVLALSYLHAVILRRTHATPLAQEAQWRQCSPHATLARWQWRCSGVERGDSCHGCLPVRALSSPARRVAARAGAGERVATHSEQSPRAAILPPAATTHRRRTRCAA